MLQAPASAQDKTPPAAKNVTPTPPQKQIDGPSSPNSGGSPDYARSSFTAHGNHPGETITYTLVVSNAGTNPGSATVLKINVPANVAVVPGSAHAQGGGLLNANSSTVNWSGTVVNTQRVTITYRVTLTAQSGNVINTATISDPQAFKSIVKSATTPIQPVSNLGTGSMPYAYKDSYAPDGSVTYNWVPTTAASSQLTLLPDGDDGDNIMPISFTFRFDGRVYTNVVVSANGLVMFNGGVGSGENQRQPIPTPGTVDSYATCFWDDQVASNAAQGIWYETFGSAPNRFTVITFVLNDFAGSPTKPYRYQMILYEGSNRNKCQYNDMSGSINGDGRHATIGVENRWGDSGVQYFFGPDGYPYYGPIENGLAILFTPGKSVYLPLARKD